MYTDVDVDVYVDIYVNIGVKKKTAAIVRAFFLCVCFFFLC